MQPLPPSYDHKAREKFWQERWEQSDVYRFRDDKPREQTFVIDTPPPTVSGVLHMGHIFSYTQADFVARFQRMKGMDVFYPMGFDDNGLPTERLVEKIREKKASQYESREAFVAACREVVKDAEEDFRKLFKSTALSVDWRLEYQTISDDVRTLSQASFLDLLRKGEAYRDFRPTYWDWVDQTAIAQAEIENKELPGVMNEIAFALEDGAPLVIATTRPELLGACVAVMYHPEDSNAAKYQGKFAITPLFGVRVPMIADELVEREKGTGLVMCCTFGDDTDKEWWRKHKLPMRPVLTQQGKIDFGNTLFASSFRYPREGGDLEPHSKLPEIPQQVRDDIQGLKPKQANAKMIELLQAEGKLLKQTPITHTVKCAERSGTPIEIIPTHQWFVRIVDKKEALLAKGAECQWYPEFMRIRLNQWIEGLKEDWCISRQRFFGVPFPVWYSRRAGEEGKLLFAAADQLPVDPVVDTPRGYKPEEVQPDVDVMDTWATSSISPQISAKSLAPNKLFPADLRPQAHEIIRTWAFYTIVKAYLHTRHQPQSKLPEIPQQVRDDGVIPWKNLMISGWCLAPDKTKMSKSKGNVVTPVALIEEKSADTVRYWASTSRLGADTAFSEDLLKIGRKLVTKLWNASQFAALNLSNLQGAPATAAQDVQKNIITETLDLWILSRLNRAIGKATQEFERFEYCDARVAIEDFFWNDFCDNYLELVKARAYGEGISKQKHQSALFTLYHCLDAILRLFAPFVPHITEEIYSHLFAARASIHARGMWPKVEDYPYNEKAERSGIAAIEILNVVRKAKSEASVSIKFPVKEVEFYPKAGVNLNTGISELQPILSDLKAAGNIDIITERDGGEFPYLSEKGWFAVRVILAKPEEQLLDKKEWRNPDQKEHEKLEGKVLHGPGAPDLSKQVVKLQVSSLPQSLNPERQR